MSVSLIRRAAVLAAVALCAAGCGGAKDDSKKIAVRGKLMDGSKPWVFDAGKSPKLPPGVSAPPVAPGATSSPIAIGFHSADGGDFVSGVLDATAGTFTASNLKPGRYKISLGLNTGMVPPGSKDPFNDKFTKDKTQIVRDLTKDGEEIVIDVSKPKG